MVMLKFPHLFLKLNHNLLDCKQFFEKKWFPPLCMYNTVNEEIYLIRLHKFLIIFYFNK